MKTKKLRSIRRKRRIAFILCVVMVLALLPLESMDVAASYKLSDAASIKAAKDARGDVEVNLGNYKTLYINAGVSANSDPEVDEYQSGEIDNNKYYDNLKAGTYYDTITSKKQMGAAIINGSMVGANGSLPLPEERLVGGNMGCNGGEDYEDQLKYKASKTKYRYANFRYIGGNVRKANKMEVYDFRYESDGYLYDPDSNSVYTQYGSDVMVETYNAVKCFGTRGGNNTVASAPGFYTNADKVNSGTGSPNSFDIKKTYMDNNKVSSLLSSGYSFREAGEMATIEMSTKDGHSHTINFGTSAEFEGIKTYVAKVTIKDNPTLKALAESGELYYFLSYETLSSTETSGCTAIDERETFVTTFVNNASATNSTISSDGSRSADDTYYVSGWQKLTVDSVISIEIRITGKNNDKCDEEEYGNGDAGIENMILLFAKTGSPTLDSYDLTTDGDLHTSVSEETQVVLSNTDSFDLTFNFSEPVVSSLKDKTGMNKLKFDKVVRRTLFTNTPGTGYVNDGKDVYMRLSKTTLFGSSYVPTNISTSSEAMFGKTADRLLANAFDSFTLSWNSGLGDFYGDNPLPNDGDWAGDTAVQNEKCLLDALADLELTDLAGNPVLYNGEACPKNTVMSDDAVSGTITLNDKNSGETVVTKTNVKNPFKYSQSEDSGFQFVIDAVTPTYTVTANAVEPDVLTQLTLNKGDTFDIYVNFSKAVRLREKDEYGKSLNYSTSNLSLRFTNGMTAKYKSGVNTKQFIFTVSVPDGEEYEYCKLLEEPANWTNKWTDYYKKTEDGKFIQLIDVEGLEEEAPTFNDTQHHVDYYEKDTYLEIESLQLITPEGKKIYENIITDYTGNILVQPIGCKALLNEETGKWTVSTRTSPNYSADSTMAWTKLTVDNTDPEIKIERVPGVDGSFKVTVTDNGSVFHVLNASVEEDNKNGIFWYMWVDGTADERDQAIEEVTSDNYAIVKKATLTGDSGKYAIKSINNESIITAPSDYETKNYWLVVFASDMTWDSARQLIQYEKASYTNYPKQYFDSICTALGIDPDKIYVELTEQPENWIGTYTNYYKLDANNRVRIAAGKTYPQFYDYNYVKLTEEPEDWATNYFSYYVNKGTDAEPDYRCVAKIYTDEEEPKLAVPDFGDGTYYKYTAVIGDRYELLTEEPDDWSTSYSDYLVLTVEEVEPGTPFETGKYYEKTAADSYAELAEEPDDWDYNTYYAVTDATEVPSTEVPEFVSGKYKEKDKSGVFLDLVGDAPADWETNYTDYYDRTNVKLTLAPEFEVGKYYCLKDAYDYYGDGDSERYYTYEYRVLATQPEDWEQNYESYYYNAGTEAEPDYFAVEMTDGVPTFVPGTVFAKYVTYNESYAPTEGDWKTQLYVADTVACEFVTALEAEAPEFQKGAYFDAKYTQVTGGQPEDWGTNCSAYCSVQAYDTNGKALTEHEYAAEYIASELPLPTDGHYYVFSGLDGTEEYVSGKYYRVSKTKDNAAALNEQPSNWTTNYRSYITQLEEPYIFAAPEFVADKYYSLSAKTETEDVTDLTKGYYVKCEDCVVKLTSDNKDYLSEVDEGYCYTMELLTKEPDNWETNYNDYYCKSVSGVESSEIEELKKVSELGTQTVAYPVYSAESGEVKNGTVLYEAKMQLVEDYLAELAGVSQADNSTLVGSNVWNRLYSKTYYENSNGNLVRVGRSVPEFETGKYYSAASTLERSLLTSEPTNWEDVQNTTYVLDSSCFEKVKSNASFELGKIYELDKEYVLVASKPDDWDENWGDYYVIGTKYSKMTEYYDWEKNKFFDSKGNLTKVEPDDWENVYLNYGYAEETYIKLSTEYSEKPAFEYNKYYKYEDGAYICVLEEPDDWKDAEVKTSKYYSLKVDPSELKYCEFHSVGVHSFRSSGYYKDTLSYTYTLLEEEPADWYTKTELYFTLDEDEEATSTEESYSGVELEVPDYEKGKYYIATKWTECVYGSETDKERWNQHNTYATEKENEWYVIVGDMIDDNLNDTTVYYEKLATARKFETKPYDWEENFSLYNRTYKDDGSVEYEGDRFSHYYNTEACTEDSVYTVLTCPEFEAGKYYSYNYIALEEQPEDWSMYYGYYYSKTAGGEYEEVTLTTANAYTEIPVFSSLTVTQIGEEIKELAKNMTTEDRKEGFLDAVISCKDDVARIKVLRSYSEFADQIRAADVEIMDLAAKYETWSDDTFKADDSNWTVKFISTDPDKIAPKVKYISKTKDGYGGDKLKLIASDDKYIDTVEYTFIAEGEALPSSSEDEEGTTTKRGNWVKVDLESHSVSQVLEVCISDFNELYTLEDGKYDCYIRVSDGVNYTTVKLTTAKIDSTDALKAELSKPEGESPYEEVSGVTLTLSGTVNGKTASDTDVEVFVKYDENLESDFEAEDEYVLLTKSPDDWTDNYYSYYEQKDGYYYTKVGTTDEDLPKWQENTYYYIEEDQYVPMSVKPADWYTNYANYYYRYSTTSKTHVGYVNWTKGKYYRYSESLGKYQLTTVKPYDWSEKFYTYYYTEDGGASYISVGSDVPAFESGKYYTIGKVGTLQIETPDDWSTNFFSYYTYNKSTKTYSAVGEIAWDSNRTYYKAQNYFSQAAIKGTYINDWNTNYGSYYVQDTDESGELIPNSYTPACFAEWKMGKYYERQVDSVGKVSYVATYPKPSDWDTKFYNYYYISNRDAEYAKLSAGTAWAANTYYEQVDTGYKDTNKNPTYVYLKLRVKPSDWDTDCTKYYYLVNSDALYTSAANTVEWSDNKFKTKNSSTGYYELLESKPADWETNRGNYYYDKPLEYIAISELYPSVTSKMEWSAGTYYQKNKDGSYTLLTSKPSDWETNKSKYCYCKESSFTKDSGSGDDLEHLTLKFYKYTDVVSDLTAKPENWESDYYNYYERYLDDDDNLKTRLVDYDDGDCPDWDDKYYVDSDCSSYKGYRYFTYVKQYVECTREEATHYAWTGSCFNANVPQWAEDTYYVRSIITGSYSLLKSMPTNWGERYAEYYAKVGTEDYKNVGSDVDWDSSTQYYKIVKSFTPVNERPDDWSMNYYKYYTIDLKYKKNTSSTWVENVNYYSCSSGVYTLLTSKPGNWSSSYADYYVIDNSCFDQVTSNVWQNGNEYFKYDSANGVFVSVTQAPADFSSTYAQYYTNLNHIYHVGWESGKYIRAENLGDDYKVGKMLIQTKKNYSKSVMTVEPDDWETEYHNFYVDEGREKVDVYEDVAFGTKKTRTAISTYRRNGYSDWALNTYYTLGDGYVELTSQPEDWTTNHFSYYENTKSYKYGQVDSSWWGSDEVYYEKIYEEVMQVAGDGKIYETEQEKKLTGWETKKFTYYLKNKLGEYVLNTEEEYHENLKYYHVVYRKLTEKPADWEDNYESYYRLVGYTYLNNNSPVWDESKQYYQDVNGNKVQLTTRPLMWEREYKNYFVKTPQFESVTNKRWGPDVEYCTISDLYYLLEEEPSDWSSNRFSYYYIASGSGNTTSKFTSGEYEGALQNDVNGQFYKVGYRAWTKDGGDGTGYYSYNSRKKIYIKLAAEPDDWRENFSSYYYISSGGITYPHIGYTAWVPGEYYYRDTIYESLTSQPVDWDEKYSSFYTRAEDGTYTAVTSDVWDENTEYYRITGIEYVLTGEKPTDWDSNFASYYEYDDEAKDYKSLKTSAMYVNGYYEFKQNNKFNSGWTKLEASEGEDGTLTYELPTLSGVEGYYVAHIAYVYTCNGEATYKYITQPYIIEGVVASVSLEVTSQTSDGITVSVNSENVEDLKYQIKTGDEVGKELTPTSEGWQDLNTSKIVLSASKYSGDVQVWVMADGNMLETKTFNLKAKTVTNETLANPSAKAVDVVRSGEKYYAIIMLDSGDVEVASSTEYSYAVGSSTQSVSALSWSSWEPYENTVRVCMGESYSDKVVYFKYRNGEKITASNNYQQVSDFSGRTESGYATVARSTSKPVSPDSGVELKFTCKEGYSVIGGNTVTVKANGVYTYKLTDGTKTLEDVSVVVAVDNIDTTPPGYSLVWSDGGKHEMTIDPVQVTVETDEDVRFLSVEFIPEGGGTTKSVEPKAYYIFRQNGTVTFTFTDACGNQSVASAKVTWIDSEEPDFTITYADTNGKLLGTSDTALSKLRVMIVPNKADCYVVTGTDDVNTFYADITENGVYTFAVSDSYERMVSKTCRVSNLITKQEAPTKTNEEFVTFEIEGEDVTKLAVTVSGTVDGYEKGVKVYDGVKNEENEIKAENSKPHVVTYTFDETTGAYTITKYYDSNGRANAILTDSLGNQVGYTFTMTLFDDQAPEVTVNAANKGIIPVTYGTSVDDWSEWWKQYLTITDNVDTVDQIKVKSDIAVNTEVAGTYNCTLTVSDTSGNSSKLVVTVVVLPDGASLTILDEHGVLYSASGRDTALVDLNEEGNIVLTVSNFDLFKYAKSDGVTTSYTNIYNDDATFTITVRKGIFREGQMKYFDTKIKNLTFDSIGSTVSTVTLDKKLLSGAGWYTIILQTAERDREYTTFFINP